MSQNRTIISGLEPDDSPRQQNSNYNRQGGGDFYSRGNGNSHRGTVVPGMDDSPAPQGGQSAPQAKPSYGKAAPQGKPVVGFLYSVSRYAGGEFWPLHIGQNVIGQNSKCDIQLPEGTVSGEHAVLVVRKMKNPEKVIASISDARSTNGTMINGVSLGFSAEECKNGDILTIGDNYELLVVLIDAPTLGLKVNPNFIAVETDAQPAYPNDEPPMFGVGAGATRAESSFDEPPYWNGGGGAPGTVGLDGTIGGNHGGTVGM